MASFLYSGYQLEDGRSAAQYKLPQNVRDQLKIIVQWKSLHTESQLEESLSNLDPISFEVPCMFFMQDFEKHRKNDSEWLGEPFYTGPQGYKLRLGVYANGYGAGYGCVSVFVHVMKGKFDAFLQWPVQGRITVKLLDQRNENNINLAETYWEGYEKVIPFTCPFRGQGISEVALQSGVSKFIGYGYPGPYDPQYQKNDKVVFAVTGIQI